MSDNLPGPCLRIGPTPQEQADQLLARIPRRGKGYVGDEEARRRDIELFSNWLRRLQTGLGVSIRGAVLDGIDLHHASLMQINAVNADLKSSNIEWTAFTASTLDEATFDHCKGQQSNWTDASANRTSFRWAKLFAAVFGRTQLQGADFFGADLSRTSFQGADLRGANLVNIKVSPLTSFRGANLTGTILAGRGLEKGCWIDVRPFYFKSWLRTLRQDLRQWFRR